MCSRKLDKETSTMADFWKGRISCWELTCCPEAIRDDCPAPRNRQYPCWEIEGTYCKWVEWGMRGENTETCLICEVYLTYGEGKPIQLKLKGQGIRLLVKH